MLPILGAAAYLLSSASASVQPGEAAFLMMVVAGLVLVGRRWLAWQRNLAQDGFLSDWSGRILSGDRTPLQPPEGLREDAARMAAALNTLIQEGHEAAGRLEAFQRAATRDWMDLDGLLAETHQQQALDQEARTTARVRLEGHSRDLLGVFEGALRFDKIELDQRLRTDQNRLQGQAFQASLEQAQMRLERLELLLEELQDTFPRLRREEDALGRLADAGLRQGARLGLSVKGLIAHTPRLLEETRARSDQFQRFRASADGVRDQIEALARRIEAFRVESQRRVRSFGGAQGAIQEIDQAAQQTGLLAVNAAILAQQGGGASGMQAIGGRLRSLADQTSQGASDLERALDEHQRGVERETAGLWDLQEVTQHLRSGIQELLRVAGHLDQQGQDLERALETHLGLVDQVLHASGRAELSLHEVGERSAAIEAALGRQWGVEAKLALELEHISRVGSHLTDVGGELTRSGRQTIDDMSMVLGVHQELRRSEAYRQLVSGELERMLGADGTTGPNWDRIAWARAQRQPRLLNAPAAAQPAGHRNPEGGIRLLCFGLDALGRAEPSAVADWSCDRDGRVWRFRLIEALRLEDHKLSLIESIKASPVEACLPGTQLRVTTDGVEVRLSFPYPGLPVFLAGLGLDLPLDEEAWPGAWRQSDAPPGPVQGLLWCGPESDPMLRASLMHLAHTWVRDAHDHDSFMPWLPYEGHRPPCPWLGEDDMDDRIEGNLRFRCLGLGADPAILHSFRDRLIAAGAEEGDGGAVLCAARLGHAHPEALLLWLFQSGAGMADSPHPDLVPFRSRLHLEVLGGADGDPYRAAWRLLEDLQRKGWLLPLSPL